MTIRRFQYDSEGRIVRETWQYVNPVLPPQEFLYAYGANGNSMGQSGSPQTFDTRLNPHQLHETWQFLSRDYSVNNPIPAAAYSTIGLPFQFAEPPGFPSKYLFAGSARSLESSYIEYETKQGTPHN